MFSYVTLKTCQVLRMPGGAVLLRKGKITFLLFIQRAWLAQRQRILMLLALKWITMEFCWPSDMSEKNQEEEEDENVFLFFPEALLHSSLPCNRCELINVNMSVFWLKRQGGRHTADGGESCELHWKIKVFTTLGTGPHHTGWSTQVTWDGWPLKGTLHPKIWLSFILVSLLRYSSLLIIKWRSFLKCNYYKRKPNHIFTMPSL